jgi:hypothetical protein
MKVRAFNRPIEGCAGSSQDGDREFSSDCDAESGIERYKLRHEVPHFYVGPPSKVVLRENRERNWIDIAAGMGGISLLRLYRVVGQVAASKAPHAGLFN